MKHLYRLGLYISIFCIFIFIFFVSVGVGVGISQGVIEAVNQTKLLVLVMVGPASFSDWMILLFMMACAYWFPIVLAIWVMKDVKKFKKRGIRATPVYWFWGMILPTVFFVAPLYFVRRQTVWQK